MYKHFLFARFLPVSANQFTPWIMGRHHQKPLATGPLVSFFIFALIKLNVKHVFLSSAFPMSENSLGGIQFSKGGIPNLSIQSEGQFQQQRPNFMDMPASSTMGTTTTKRTTTRTTTTATTATPIMSGPPASSTMSPAQMHTLRDAIMDPMMMAVGTMLAMAGAYMAIAIQELNQANAFAFAQLAAGGR